MKSLEALNPIGFTTDGTLENNESNLDCELLLYTLISVCESCGCLARSTDLNPIDKT